MAEKLRIREPGKHALLNPVTLNHESPGIDDRYGADHVLVKAFPWAFASESEIAAKAEDDRTVTAVRISDLAPVESAEAAPGQVTRRTRRDRA